LSFRQGGTRKGKRPCRWIAFTLAANKGTAGRRMWMSSEVGIESVGIPDYVNGDLETKDACSLQAEVETRNTTGRNLAIFSRSRKKRTSRGAWLEILRRS